MAKEHDMERLVYNCPGPQALGTRPHALNPYATEPNLRSMEPSPTSVEPSAYKTRSGIVGHMESLFAWLRYATILYKRYQN